MVVVVESPRAVVERAVAQVKSSTPVTRVSAHADAIAAAAVRARAVRSALGMSREAWSAVANAKEGGREILMTVQTERRGRSVVDARALLAARAVPPRAS